MSITPRIVILTGAGVSAESGLPTFRDAQGLWENHRVEDVATPEAFARDPALVHRFYNLRRAALKTVEPNAAHLALAQLQEALPDDVTLITQNVDDLHERAGALRVIHMHGELLKIRCLICEEVSPWENDLHSEIECRLCGEKGSLRPDIVWFGETPYFLDEIEEALGTCQLFASIGTSGLVYPAAGFVRAAKVAGAECLEFNLDKTDVSHAFDEHRIGPASVEVAKWVASLIERHAG